VAKPAAQDLSTAGWGKGVARVSWNPGQFRAVLVLIETVGGGLDGSRFKQRTGGKAGVQCWPFLKSKRKSVMKGGTNMIGMGLDDFLVFLILGLIAAFVLHSVVRYRFLEGLDGFLAKWVAGWFGAWLGSPILGHWLVKTGDVYVIPALVGAFASAFLVTATWKASAKVYASKAN
jgi:uncharacterized membrane protein YeaQ/YmgE (transglycosylase-associated protein family)